ncbi:MAG: hypothetical protein WC654_08535, partial [Patescibacteria group bacterium]
EIVVSGDICFPFTPGLDWQAGAPEIFHKLPLRAYVGIRREGPQGTCVIGQTQVYDSVHDAFREDKEPLLPLGELKDFLDSYIRGHLKNTRTGIRIDFLVETVEQRGLSAPVASLLIAGIRLLCGAETLAQVDMFARDTKSQAFAAFHADTLKLRSQCYFGTGHGTKEFAGIVAADTPSVYFTEERRGSIEAPHDTLFPSDVSLDPERLSTLNWWGFPLSQFHCEGSFPLDIVSLYQEGSERNYRVVATHVKHSLMPSFDALRDDACRWFADVRGTSQNDRLPAFLKTIADGDYFQQFIRGHSFKHLEVLRMLITLYQQPLDSSVATRMLETIDSILHTHAPFVELASDYTQLRVREIKQRADELGIHVAIRAFHWGKQDGNLFVYSRIQTFREPLLELVRAWSQQTSHRVQADFLSWRDGFGKEGLRVDQHVTAGRVASLSGEGIRRLTTWQARTGYVSRLIGGKDQVHADVLFDAVHHRVFVAGKPVTSKDLPSQKATIAIFQTLFRSIGATVPCRELPARTYSAYRNELQGKIFGPLGAVVEERCGKPLGVHIHGSLTDFTVTCEPKGLSFGLIEECS